MQGAHLDCPVGPFGSITNRFNKFDVIPASDFVVWSIVNLYLNSIPLFAGRVNLWSNPLAEM